MTARAWAWACLPSHNVQSWAQNCRTVGPWIVKWMNEPWTWIGGIRLFSANILTIDCNDCLPATGAAKELASQWPPPPAEYGDHYKEKGKLSAEENCHRIICQSIALSSLSWLSEWINELINEWVSEQTEKKEEEEGIAVRWWSAFEEKEREKKF